MMSVQGGTVEGADGNATGVMCQNEGRVEMAEVALARCLGVVVSGKGSRAVIERGSIKEAGQNSGVFCQYGASAELDSVTISDCRCGVSLFHMGSSVKITGGAILGCVEDGVHLAKDTAAELRRVTVLRCGRHGMHCVGGQLIEEGCNLSECAQGSVFKR